MQVITQEKACLQAEMVSWRHKKSTALKFTFGQKLYSSSHPEDFQILETKNPKWLGDVLTFL
jgi:hypothetical protein